MITPATTPTAFWLNTELVDTVALAHRVDTRSTGATIHRNRQWLTVLVGIAEELTFYGDSEADAAQVAGVVAKLRANLLLGR